MNSLMEEILAEEHRKDIIRDFANIRLQEQAMENKTTHQNWFTHMMRRLGQWLISSGEKLVRRYDIPANCTMPSEQGYAH